MANCSPPDWGGWCNKHYRCKYCQPYYATVCSGGTSNSGNVYSEIIPYFSKRVLNPDYTATGTASVERDIGCPYGTSCNGYSGWVDADALGEAAARSTAVGEQMPDDVRWIRSYVLDERSGKVDTVCIYEASSEQAIRNHAQVAELSVTDIIPIADTVIVRPDPE